MDKRKELIENRLRYFSNAQLQKIAANQDILCTDEFNYNEKEKTFCPLAIALGLHEKLENPTDERVSWELSGYFKPVNVLKSVPGIFYHGSHKERVVDLLDLVADIINERQELEKQSSKFETDD